MTDMPTETTVPVTANQTTAEAEALTNGSSPTLADATAAVVAAAPSKPKSRFASAAPVLEKLFEFYPQLFGQRFLPLKLGVYQDLLAAHPDVFKRDTLKTALGVHTRSTPYLQCVAAGLDRHDLQGQAVEPVAPEHVFLSVVELHQRRQSRTKENLHPKLLTQLRVAYERSGLSKQDYLARLGTPSEELQATLDEAIAQVDQQRAKRQALVQAYESSGKTPEEFAGMLGMALGAVKDAIQTRSVN